jgi:hypothetical protein
MFSTLLGPLPVDPDPSRAPRDAAERLLGDLDDVADLEATGLELISDGGPPAGPDLDAATVVGRWEAAAGASGAPVKQVLLGPWSASRSGGGPPEAVAERLRPTILALAAAGCPLVEVAEPDALAIAGDPAAASAFSAAHARLVDGSEGIHCSLALTGGNLDGAGPAAFFDLAYASYAFDLIAGPDNWRLIAEAPVDRGIVCGALGLGPRSDETRELLVWAAHYAASTRGRGLARVGLANAPAPAGEPGPARADVLRRLAIVAEASRIAAVESSAEMAGLLDPRAIGPRSTAPGRFAPARRRRR